VNLDTLYRPATLYAPIRPVEGRSEHPELRARVEPPDRTAAGM